MHTIAMILVALALDPAAAQVKNPVAATAESAANGGKVFARSCAACHGKEGKGDGLAGAKLTPKPSDLTDAEWKHGATDGEIFLVIHDGVKDTGMKAYGSRMTEHELWDLVNYIRSLKR
jgi:mono/diheme cytochrome c family protein